MGTGLVLQMQRTLLQPEPGMKLSLRGIELQGKRRRCERGKMTTTSTTTIIRPIEIFCRSCNQQIRFDKNHRTAKGKWIPLEERTDSVGQKVLQPHQCPAKQKQQQKQPPLQQPVATTTTTTTTDISKEIAAIKAQLLVLVSRLDRLEQELQK